MKKTISSIFLVPTLQIPGNELKSNNFINGYIEDADQEIPYPDSVYLLFQPENIPKFREFLDDEYERTVALIEDYDYSGGYVVVVYKLDPYFKKDFQLIKNGEYSKTSSQFQDLFKKVVKIKKKGLHRDEVSLQYRIFNKSEDMIKYWQDKLGIDWDEDFEVWDGFNIKNETLNIKLIKKTQLI